jgi:hypothetical protein
MVDVARKQILKDHIMPKTNGKKSPHELVDLLRKHNPHASIETIADIISDWGDLSDDRRFDAQESIDIETATPNGQRQSGNMNIERQGARDG